MSRRVAIVASRWNEKITSRLVDGARKGLTESGFSSQQIDIFWVYGAYELPQAVQALADTKRYEAIVPIGCLIRGETSHFDYIAQVVSRGLDDVGRRTGVAVSFGVLTVENAEQASARAGGKFGNKGEEAALAAVELAALMKETHGPTA